MWISWLENHQGNRFDALLPSWYFTIMVKTQVQIPDELFIKAKKVAEAHEWSFAEIVRRGLEYMTRVNPPDRKLSNEWSLPEPVEMGLLLPPESEWTTLCHGD